MESDKTTTISELREKVKDFIHERDWAKYHNPKDIAVSITIEVGELLEIFQWVKENELDEMVGNPKKLVELEEELADIIIYCLSLANVLNIDVSKAVTEKIDKNNEKYPIDKVKGHYKKYTELGVDKHE